MSTQPKNVQEKRAERRFPINSIVQMTLANNKKLTGRCCNISGSGMLVRADRGAAVGASITLQIQEGKIDYQADAEVVRVAEDDDSFLIALKVNKQIN